MPLVSTQQISGLGVDPATTAALVQAARMLGPMTGSFQFPAIREFLEKARLRYGSEVVDEVYRTMPVLQKTDPVVVDYPGVSVAPTPETPDVMTAFAAGPIGATVPLLIAAGLALMFILKR